MYIKNKGFYFLIGALCLMVFSILLSLRAERNALVNATTFYVTMDGERLAKEYMETIVHNDKFEAVMVINEPELDIPLDIYTRGEICYREDGFFSLRINEDYVSSMDMDNENGFFSDKYLNGKRKLSLFKSAQVVEKLPNNYRLVLLSNSPVKRMIAVKWQGNHSSSFPDTMTK
ncbi:hypothetical protein [Vibrio sp. AND4]|uniref:hypothetical protein n=1 Tax=Vibrio sp. AND4 TaxID=314289 RepID=UPI00015F14AF|nr:hypothetical protein [Vibrio sp. AND4]EDP58200.1 hypothetical protein AND4_16110 [Vibrio sp. AND4]